MLKSVEIDMDKLHMKFLALNVAGLPGARSEISEPNVYKISGQFQDIFVGFMRFMRFKET